MDKGDITISEAFELYRVDYISFKGLSVKTEEAYITASKLLTRLYGDMKMQELTFAHIREWRIWLSGWQKSDTTRSYIICLRMVLKFLRKRGFIVLDPDNIPVPIREGRIVSFLNELEYEQFITAVALPRRGYSKINRIRNVAVIELLYATGLRNSELCSLNRDSIKDRTFTVIGKGRKPRIGFVSSEAMDAIDNYLKLRTDNDRALFVSEQTGKRMSAGTLRRVFQNVCARTEFEHITPHTIRHSYATKLLRRHVDVRYVKEFLGHSSLETTQMYTHVVDEDLKAIYDKVHAY